MSRSLDRSFSHWFVFGGYSDPGFKGRPEYNPDAPCDLADEEGDVFSSIPLLIAEKLISARKQFLQRLEEIEEEYPQLMSRVERSGRL